MECLFCLDVVIVGDTPSNCLFCSYVAWLKAEYPEGGTASGLMETLERATRHFTVSSLDLSDCGTKCILELSRKQHAVI
jgi:hypothetical protein